MKNLKLISDSDFQAQMIASLDITSQPIDFQNEMLVKVASIAHKRLGSLLPDLLSEKQLNEIGAMRQSGKSDDEVLDWIQSEIPNYKALIQASMLDIADEMVPKNKSS